MAQFRMNSLAALCLLCAIASTPAIAQISSDGTLSTTVTAWGENDLY
ncbi:MAG: hypothetical protein SVX43_19000 [Cyanobacteriota bacterium]|nr:hypothetical protein [Cyanobacteriota bacterium]